MTRLRILALIPLLTASVLAYAVERALPDMKFSRLNTRDGLSNSQVNCIMRDSRGFVWIGTPYGLNRYDGYRVKTYFADAADTTTLRSNYIDDMAELADGRLVLRQGPEFTFYDPSTDRFDRSPARELERMGIVGGIERIYVDAKRCLWVKTYDRGIYRYRPADGRLTLVRYGRNKGDFPADVYASSVTDSEGRLIIASSNGELFCLDGDQGRVMWQTDYMRQHGGPANEGYIVRTDGQGTAIWVTTRHTVFTYLPRTGQWFDTLEDYLAFLGVSGLPSGLEVWDILRDVRGWLWLATDHHGVFVVDTENCEVRHFMSSKSDETSLCENTIRTLHQDAQGRVWIGSYRNGVSQYTKSLANVRNVALGDINAICEDRQGRYWLGTNDRGIICYDPVTGRTDTYNRANRGFRSDVIVATTAARDGSLWFGTYNGGLIRWHDGRFTNFTASGDRNALANNNVWGLTEDRWGRLWIATLGSGVQRYDPRTNRFTSWNTSNSPLRSGYMTSLAWSRKGWLMAGSSEFYSLVQPQTGQVVNRRILALPGQPAAMSATADVMQDSRGLVWQCSTAGACVFDVRTGRQWMIDRSAGLDGSSAVAVEEDLHHTMWVVTEHGVAKVLPQPADDGGWTFLVRSYTARDGLQQGAFNARAITCTRAGLILVGGQDGIDIINPDLITTERTAERPVFSGLTLFDREVRPGQSVGGRVVLTEALDVCRRLHLRHAENQFTVQLGSTSGEVHNRSRFVYRLKGISSQWTTTDAANPNVTFTGLPSGSYTLCVRMLNDDGTMGDEESRLGITIDAPWYRSWWMCLVYLGLLLVAARWLYRRYQEKLRLDRMKMVQENSHQLDELRQRFYDTVSDELRQPFQNTFESLNTMMTEETDEQRYEREQQVFSHVESLLEQVNHLTEQGKGRQLLRPEIREMEITSLDEKLVRDATAYVEQNLDNSDISVETMAQELGMSRVHLYKKLMSVTGTPPSEFIRDIRLRYAEQLLRKSQLSVAEVAYKVGFNNPRYFTKYFKEKYGMIPSEYKIKYQ